MEHGSRSRAETSLVESIKAEARRLGFHLVGVASADPFPEAEERLLAWVRQGRHGQMHWIDEQRARRSCRPSALLPGARSIVVVGVAYAQGAEPAPPPLHGRVARYARGRDYHDLLKPRLWSLVGFMRQQARREVRARVTVDTSPLVEREAAVRAGLGFFGKNTCLLAPGAGSYVLLGAVISDLDLEPERAPPRDCGTCRLCLDACPTGALTAPYELDARRCISYLTIEHRDTIPAELRSGIGQRVFGCDICQEVCPWTRGRGPLPWPELMPTPPAGPDLELTDLFDLDDEGFRERFRGSPIKRARRRGLLRNAAVVLGNRGDPAAVPTLARALSQDPDPLVRAHAAWALGRLGGDEALAALGAALDRESDEQVRQEILAQLPGHPRG